MLLLDLQQQENTMLIVVTHSVELANLLERRLQITDGALFENGSG
jgi:ABC-type lipoprotein export system ATPase subunit